MKYLIAYESFNDDLKGLQIGDYVLIRIDHTIGLSDEDHKIFLQFNDFFEMRAENGEVGLALCLDPCFEGLGGGNGVLGDECSGAVGLFEIPSSGLPGHSHPHGLVTLCHMG